ncbi:MAG TPA: heparinase II/III family protein, partial [Puia sp.]|nr:heparinase II/III family protein [Puia sp.]
ADSLTARSPFLLVNKKEIEQIRNDITDTAGWKYNSWILLKKNADELLDQELEIPPRGGNWEQYYIGPSGYSLIRGRLIGNWQWEHLDTLTGEVMKGDTSVINRDYDGVIIGGIHNAWALGALQLGLAFQISGNPAYAGKAKGILLAYADLYPGLPIRNKQNNLRPDVNGVGKIHVQNLNEAIWLMDMAQAADLIWNTLNSKEREKIIHRLFLPGVSLFTVNRTAWNIQCWQNAAMGMIGFLINDKNLIHRAMADSLYGFSAQLKNDVGREGIWAEPTLNYHFYSLEALIQLAIAARNYGYPVDTRDLQKMFDGPLDLCNESYSIPAFNNSGITHLPTMESYLYEWAYAEYGDDRYLPVLIGQQRGRFRNSGPHFTGWGLLFGKKNVHQPPPGLRSRIHSKFFSDMGVVMLSAEKQDKNLICYVKYNNHKDPHSHPDNLAFDLVKGRENLVILSGASNYYSPLYLAWYKNTLSSNSFLVDERPQKETIGRCLAFGKSDTIAYTIVENSNMYSFPHGIRTVALLTNDLVFIFDQINAGTSPRLLDITVHPGGRWAVNQPGVPWSDTTTGYNLIRGAKISTDMQEGYISTVLPSGRRVMISARQDSMMHIITGYGKKYLGQDLPIAIYRRKADRAVMAWCISSVGEKVKIAMNHLMGANGKLLALSTAAKVSIQDRQGRIWTVIINPYKVPLAEKEGNEKDFILSHRPAEQRQSP